MFQVHFAAFGFCLESERETRKSGDFSAFFWSATKQCHKAASLLKVMGPPAGQ